ncbi:hypothetical protein [Klebsiella oxytoca]|uniref:hypothetical protein n=1 Tax=Klebsiella oxytoca TaxID=571 RepID=UPI0039B6F37E
MRVVRDKIQAVLFLKGIRDVGVLIDSALKGYLFLLLDMWPVLLVAFVGLAFSFYGVLMPKTAITLLLLAVVIGIAGGIYA